jgi:hypothetical protein
MKTKFVDAREKSAIPYRNTMSAPSAAVNSVNALNLASRMDIGIDILSHAIGVDSSELSSNPRDPKLQEKLMTVVALWDDLVILAGDEAQARLFLKQQRPELQGNSPVYYLQRGRPNVVRNLVFAMLEMLP